jgi:phospholipid-binding lipoprotein MlaA
MKRIVPPVILLVLCLSAAGALADTASLSNDPPTPAVQAARSDPTPQQMPAHDFDPWEPLNRKVFWFNDHLDMYVIEPAAKGWDFVLPKRVQTSVGNFFANLRFPINTVNNLLQGKVQYAATDVGRFVVNTTVGAAGFFDPARSFGLQPRVEDFGQTLGVWGVRPGPYLVLPILGPSTLRDGAGILVDYPLTITPFFVDWYYLFAARTVEVVNFRASVLDSAQQAKEASLDYYSLVRNAYLQRRASVIGDQAPMSKEKAEDLYHPQED